MKRNLDTKPFPQLDSIKDPIIMQARALATAQKRKEAQKCLAQGIESIKWVIDASLPIEVVLISEKQIGEPFVQELLKKGLRLTYKGEELLAKIWIALELEEDEILRDFSDDEKNFWMIF